MVINNHLFRTILVLLMPLTDLADFDCVFQWTNLKQEAFDDLMKRLTEHPILVYSDFLEQIWGLF